MVDQLAPLSDENTLVIPKGWRRRLHPRRGGVPGPKITIGGAAGEALRSLEEDGRAEAEHLIADPGCDRELAESTRRHLAGDADPRGAALLAAVMIGRSRIATSEEHERFVDGWVAVHGPAFAACAFTELCDIDVKPGQVLDIYRMPPAARRLRALLAAIGDQEYQEAVDRLAERRGTPMKRFITAYLVPTRLDWVDECCAAPDCYPRQMMLCTLGSAGQLELVGGWANLTYPDCYLENLATMAEGVGPAIAPLLAEAMDRLDPDPERRRALLDVLSALPSDEAFELLLERVDRPHFRAALLEAMSRYPVRAIRLLAQADGATAAELLNEHLSANAELLVAVVADLPAEVQEVIERITAAVERVPEASAEALPPLLVDPPWAREKPKTKPVVIKGLTPATGPSMAWEPGERERWLHTGLFYPARWPMDEPLESGRHWESPPTYDKDPGWARRIEDLRSGRLLGYDEVPIITLGPEQLIRPLLADWRPRGWNSSDGTCRPEEWMRHVVARYELDALPVAVQFATSNAARFGSLLLPYLDAQVAALAADWLLRVKTAREIATVWFGMHGAAAVPFLLPAALGRLGTQRRGAEYALHFLASELGGDAVIEAARAHGDDAVAAIEALLAADPRDLVPRKVPKVGEWAAPGALSQVLLRGRERALPAGAVRHLVTMLAMSTPEEVDPGIAVVRELCDGESLAEFGWALFERWRERGETAGDAWAVTALGCVGDDETARRLTPIIRAWPGEGGHAKASEAWTRWR
ncbi:hypothetical protein [Actinomadura alba]|uniref:HEAT repeat domain-containing protein n=1 Tax=Actinomadura alba TaxID=406431 RepID=A0ABR7LSF6_9ACTN|nr:hypothetical protein [Actinomadura alba]MBC6467795.1 hypothetical protein [Actinomadura alba]